MLRNYFNENVIMMDRAIDFLRRECGLILDDDEKIYPLGLSDKEIETGLRRAGLHQMVNISTTSQASVAIRVMGAVYVTLAKARPSLRNLDTPRSGECVRLLSRNLNQWIFPARERLERNLIEQAWEQHWEEPEEGCAIESGDQPGHYTATPVGGLSSFDSLSVTVEDGEEVGQFIVTIGGWQYHVDVPASEGETSEL